MPAILAHNDVESQTYKYANTPSVKALSASGLKAANRKRRFQDVYPVLRDELVSHFEQSRMPRQASEWFKSSLDYNVPHGKLNRGLSVVDTVEILKGRPLDDIEYFQAATLGWCIEFLQAMFLVSDDMMDLSITRRGQPCWYRVPGVGNIAVNDALMIETSIYFLLKKYFRSEPYYVDLLELFHDVTFQTEMGQIVDLITAPEDDINLDNFSLEKHQYIVVFKTAFYSFYLPVALGMHMAGVTCPKAFLQARDILIPLGEYFQVQDDYLDCYGTPEMIGKIGTDIIDNKCSWNVNIALKFASLEQRKVLDENYGRKDAACERRVKEVFAEIGVERLYKEYEQNAYTTISAMIDTIDETSKPGEVAMKKLVFRTFLEKIYGRTK